MTTTTPLSIQSTRWSEITAIWRDNRWLFALAGWLLGMVTVVTLQRANVDMGQLLHDLVPEAVGIVFTVFILERFAANRALHERKLGLFRQAKSRSNHVAVEAVEQIGHEGWWEDFLVHYSDTNKHPNLQYVQWIGGIDLKGINLQSANLSEANLQSTNLSEANLQEAVLWRANLQEASLKEANLQSARLTMANLQSADLRGANLRSVSSRGANLKEADFTGANLQEADFAGANLQFANLERADMQSTRLKETELQSANLERANLQKADLKEANLQGAVLTGADLHSARLTGANLQEANFEGANLQETNLSEANLQSTNIERAKLQSAILRGANLQSTVLRGANLLNVDLTDAKFDEKTVLPDAKQISENSDEDRIYNAYWTPETDMTRYTNANHPEFWEPKWVQLLRKKKEAKSG